LDRNECTILCLAGIKKSEVPNLQEQLRLLFRLVVDRGHRVALIDLQATPHISLVRWALWPSAYYYFGFSVVLIWLF
jgi:hypothetical protein